MLAPWMGGACAVPGIIVVPPTPTSGGGGGGGVRMFFHDRDRPKALPVNDDAEIQTFLQLWCIWNANNDD